MCLKVTHSFIFNWFVCLYFHFQFWMIIVLDIRFLVDSIVYFSPMNILTYCLWILISEKSTVCFSFVAFYIYLNVFKSVSLLYVYIFTMMYLVMDFLVFFYLKVIEFLDVWINVFHQSEKNFCHYLKSVSCSFLFFFFLLVL